MGPIEPLMVEVLLPNPSFLMIVNDYFIPRKKLRISLGPVEHMGYVTTAIGNVGGGRIIVQTTGAPLKR